jgi:CelD/BcsL family acetyltransferase involved in cellulose biosynthesis
MSAIIPTPATAAPRPGPERHPPQPAPFALSVHRSADELAPLTAAWDDLARNALEPNAFLEPWFLLPALHAFAAGQDVRVVVVTTPDPQRPHGPRRLSALIPLQGRRWYRGLPVACLSFWHHAYSYLGAPLLRADGAAATFDHFREWLAKDAGGAALLELPLAPADGPFQQLLIDHCRRHARPAFVAESYTRALFRPRESAAAYFKAALPMKRRKELERLQRRLAETGALELRVLERPEDAAAFAEDFLALEAAGWKGREGTAFGSRPADRAFFRDMVVEGAGRGRVEVLGLYRDGKAVALKCNLLAPPGAFAFKIAYDESLAHFSPGVQLEASNVERLHGGGSVRWMDSCAVADHPMINRLWPDRRPVQTLLLATGRRGGDLAVSLLPLARWLKRLFTRRPAPAAPEETDR